MIASQKVRTKTVYHTSLGDVVHGDALKALPVRVKAKSVDLIVTSPPYGLLRKKEYGNVEADEYVAWFKPFGEEFKRILKPSGSLVIDIGGAWISGQLGLILGHPGGFSDEALQSGPDRRGIVESFVWSAA